ncbi:MAG: UvrD-helicase domain-containing protein [Treponema sp.]|nr:UvrD-helicase domain-containing protein [Treponema sp.]
MTKKNIPSYLEQLNPEQRQAVEHDGSPLLILAGAGSGKTRVITTKIAYLIGEKHVDARSILAATFTKKAANEMRERAIAFEGRAEQAQICTFHSFGAWFLRRHADEAHLAPSFTVYDDDDMATLVARAVPSLTKQQSQLYAHKIALAKDYFLTSDDDLSALDLRGDLNEIYKKYEARLLETGNADFGDLIMKPVHVMEENLRIRENMRYRFRVIMVDEYQDSNVAQFRLLQALAGVDENSGTYVCVVGDDDQSIYKFRGAEIQNILTFREKFPNTKIIKLVRNYRSTAKILAAADAVVNNNTGRIGKTLLAERGEGKQPVLAYVLNQDEEAIFCANMIQKSVEKNAQYSDWAILYRTNAQSLSFEQEFLRRKIPYAVVGSLKFYEREEIKDTLAFLSLVANERDEIAFRRIVNKPVRGIGEKTQDMIVALSREKSQSLIASASAIEGLAKKAKEGVREFCAAFEEIIKTFSSDGKLSLLIEKIITAAGLLEYHRTQDEIASTQRVANMQELMNSAALYECSMDGLLAFLDSIALDRSLEAGSDEESDRVTLITLHNTKGLEFPRVVITGMENGVFPRGDKTSSELEEERRLFYVGITRAQNELYVTSCMQRRMYGRTEFMEPSIFLEEAGDVFRVIGKKPHDDAYGVSRYGGAYRSWERGSTWRGMQSVGAENALLQKWQRGVRVFHDDYGYGSIVKSSMSGDGEFVIAVQFENGAQKKFMPEYQSHLLMIVRE